MLQIETLSPRDFATDKHRSVDDTPYGGGSGMVMMPEPLARRDRGARRVRCSARAAYRATACCSARRARRSRRRDARAAAPRCPGIVLVCGRYEGVDERVAELVDEQISLGDFVLTGGEVAAMAVIEAVARLLPGVLGNAGVARRGVARRGAARVPAVHAAARVSRHAACPRCCSRATTPRSRAGAASRRCCARARAAPICSRSSRSATRTARCSTSREDAS